VPETLRLVIVGHVDHGKSTLIGRLLHDTDSLPEGKILAIKASCERRGMPFEFAFLLDALQSERDQGITIDTTQIWLRGKERDVVIIDAPGHKEFLRNMVTGAAQADAAILVIDAAEGIKEQTRRHGYLLSLLGVRQLVVVVNKMDLIDFDQDRFSKIEAGIRSFLSGLRLPPSRIIPLSAHTGANVVTRSATMPWYDGPALFESLNGLNTETPAIDQPLRLPIQDVYKFDARRILVGRIESGRLAVGDQLLFSPANTVARVASIEQWPVIGTGPREAHAGQPVGITLSDPLFIERGALASQVGHAPIETDVFRARLFWLGRKSVEAGATLTMRLATAEFPVVVQSIERVFDSSELALKSQASIERNDVAEVTMRTKRLVALDTYAKLPRTGRFVLVADGQIVGGGAVFMDGYADQRALVTRRATNVRRHEHQVTLTDRERRNGHAGGVLWLTGLPSSGKSTLAVQVEKRLFDMGYQVYVLDGDNFRHGLCADLGFLPEDRAENVRRIGEVAALMSRAGFIAITALISPYRSTRTLARAAAGAAFHEVHVRASAEICAQRDPKGLWARARRGEIRDFTGVDAPYEEPEAPDLIVDTEKNNIEVNVAQIVEYVATCVSKRRL
jgi:bifunctional enzyme CysN/CysC